MSRTIFAPGFLDKKSVASMKMILSAVMMVPSFCIIPTRSPSPSKANPKSACVSWTFCIKSLRFSGRSGSG